jgi:tetratricopeptide (TPR) repeat protein
MDAEQLVRDLREVRERGIARTKSEKVPSLTSASRYLELDLDDLIAEAAAKLDAHEADGIRIALGLGEFSRHPADGRQLSSADRRAAFAEHNRSTSETVRRRGNLEDQTFTKLAKVILRLIEEAPGETGSVARLEEARNRPPNKPRLGRDPDATVRALKKEAEAQGRWDEAASWSAALVALVQRATHATPIEGEARLAAEYRDAGASSLMAGQLEEAQAHLHNARQVTEMLIALDPGDSEYQDLLATTLVLLSGVLMQGDALQSAEDAIISAVPLLQKLVEHDGDNEAHRAVLSFGLTMLGTVQFQTFRYEDAIESLSRAVDQAEFLVAQSPSDIHSLILVAQPLTALGLCYFYSDQESTAETVIERAVLILQPILGEQPVHSWSQALVSTVPLMFAQASFALGMIYGYTERFGDAEHALTVAVEVIDTQTSREPSNDLLTSLFSNIPAIQAQALVMLAVVYLETERPREADTALARAMQLFNALADARPLDVATLEMVADHLEMVAEIYQETDHPSLAENARERARIIRLQRPGGSPDGSS